MSASDIFFSYAREDKARVEPLVTALKACGSSVFWDRDVPPGKTWPTHIGEALDRARCVVVAWSEHSIRSKYVLEEAGDGEHRGILVPVLLSPVRPPFGFRQIQAADLSSWAPGHQSTEFDSFVVAVNSMRIPAPSSQDQITQANLALFHTSFLSPKSTARFNDGNTYYQIEVIVVAGRNVMDRIAAVRYILEDSWPPEFRVRTETDRASRFKMKDLANGTSIIRAEVQIRNRTEPLYLNRYIDLRPDGPRL